MKTAETRRGQWIHYFCRSWLNSFKAVSCVSSEERKNLSKRKWHRKRHLKREAREQTTQAAAADGRAPPGPRLSLNVRWDKLLEGKRVLTRRTLDRLLPRALWREGRCESKHSRGKSSGNRWVDQQAERGAGGWHQWYRCHGLRRRTQEAQEGEGQSRWTDSRNPAKPSLGAKNNALGGNDATRVHFGIAAGMVRVHGSAGTENCWSELSSKIAGKILGYMFLASLPQLDFRSRQTAFVNGCHANIGAHMYLRIGALCSEWNLECDAAQLDVWKAFDHVCHAAALRAMEAMGVGAHSRALMAKAWSLSKVSVQDWQPRPVNQ